MVTVGVSRSTGITYLIVTRAVSAIAELLVSDLYHYELLQNSERLSLPNWLSS